MTQYHFPFRKLFIFCYAESSLVHAGFLCLQWVRSYPTLQCTGFSLQLVLFLWSRGFSSCSAPAQCSGLPSSRAQASVAAAYQLSARGSQALEHRLQYLQRTSSVLGAPELRAQASVAAAHQLSAQGSRALEHRLSSCSARALVAPQHVGFSWTRDWTHVPCMDRWILIHYHQGSPTQYHFLVTVHIQISPVIPQSSLYNLIFSWPAIQFRITYCV